MTTNHKKRIQREAHSTDGYWGWNIFTALGWISFPERERLMQWAKDSDLVEDKKVEDSTYKEWLKKIADAEVHL